MADLTPAQLALELGVTAKRIRTILRARYGTLPSHETRRQLTDEQAAHVRAELAGKANDPGSWPLEPGDVVLRRELHERFGGSRQNGIVTLPGQDDILIFSGSGGSSHGYAVHEGYREDGSFGYTGEGQVGDQEFLRGNKAIRDSAANGKRLQLFTVEGTRAQYVGEFTTGEPTYRVETIPDRNGSPRKGIIFNLVPVSADMSLLGEPEGPLLNGAEVLSWMPPDASDIVIAQTEEAPPGERVVSRIEMQLQADFGEWSRERNDPPSRLLLRSDGATIEPDLYLAGSGFIVEAKKSISRNLVRTAIGQVLDYTHVAERHGTAARPMVLLPGRPAPDLMTLMSKLGITVAFRGDGDFEVVEPASAD